MKVSMLKYPKNKLVVALFSAGALLMSACDGSIRVKGHVYRQSSTKGESQAIVDGAHPDVANLTPVPGAKVILYHGGDYEKKPIDKSTVWQSSATSESDGSFDVGGTTSPFKFHAALVVQQEGYKSLTKIFLHDKFDHDAIIVLVPLEDANPDTGALNKRDKPLHRRAKPLPK